MSAVHQEDRGLAAVLRVREVREQDSRLGLQHAVAEERAVVGRLDRYETHLGATTVPEIATPTELVTLNTMLRMLGAAITETRADAATALALVADARARWTTDKARVAAVDHLLEQRAEVRRLEAERRTTAALDDIAAQRWQRTHDQENHA